MRMLIALGTVVLCTVLTYTTLFMPGFAIRQLGLPQAGSFLATVLTGAIQIVLVPVFGAMSDRHGRLPIMIAAGSIALVVSYPMFAWLVDGADLADASDRSGHHGCARRRLYGSARGADVRHLPDANAHHRPRRQLFVLRRDFRRLCALHQCLADCGTGSHVAPSFYLMFAAAISLTALAAHLRLRL